MYLPAWPGVAAAAVDTAAVCGSKRPYRAGRTRAVANTAVPGPPSHSHCCCGADRPSSSAFRPTPPPPPRARRRSVA